MDTATATSLIGIITGAAALAVSVFNLLYVRRQLEILRKDTERKKGFEETSRAARQAIDTIKSVSDYFDFFSPLDIWQAEILAYIHDNKLDKLKIVISKGKFEIEDAQSKPVEVKTSLDVIETIKSWLTLPYKICVGSISFECEPNILSSSFIELGDAFGAIADLYRAHELLEPYDFIIKSFDNEVLDDLKQAIDELVQVITKSSMSKHEINFSANDTSEQIFQKLLNEIVGKKSVDRLVHKLVEIGEQRLTVVQRETFLRS